MRLSPAEVKDRMKNALDAPNKAPFLGAGVSRSNLF